MCIFFSKHTYLHEDEDKERKGKRKKKKDGGIEEKKKLPEDIFASAHFLKLIFPKYRLKRNVRQSKEL